jgi:hypothetical protein
VVDLNTLTPTSNDVLDKVVGININGRTIGNLFDAKALRFVSWVFDLPAALS